VYVVTLGNYQSIWGIPLPYFLEWILIDQLRAGEVTGEQTPRTHYIIFKVRIRNSDIQKRQTSFL